MAVAAEYKINTALPYETYPEVQVFSSLPGEQIVREQTVDFIGRVLTKREVTTTADIVENPENLQPIGSLYEAVQRAAAGDEKALAMTKTNVRTDTMERTMKAGFVMEVSLDIDETGQTYQYGQSAEAIYANTLLSTDNDSPMFDRTVAEVGNKFRLKEAYTTKALDDAYFVVISRAADNMTIPQMDGNGFFTETMSCAIQVLSIDGAGRLRLESAFVAGKRDLHSERHDGATIQTMLYRLGVDIGNISATELLATPFLIPKCLMPNGVIDLVARYDDAAGGTFYGQNKPRQDYAKHKAACEQRQAELSETVEAITAELIARRHEIHTMEQATELLGKLSGAHLIQRAIHDMKINPDVFGKKSSALIEVARWHTQNGNIELARIETERAIRHDRSESCPTGARSKNDAADSDGGASNDSERQTDDDADCEFVSKECPECGEKNVKTTVSRDSRGVKKIEGDCGCTKIIANQSSFALAA